FSSRRRHTSSYGDWSSDVCSSDLDSCTQGQWWVFHCPRQSQVLGSYLPCKAWMRVQDADLPTACSADGVTMVLSSSRPTVGGDRSEERRVGKECRGRWRRNREDVE